MNIESKKQGVFQKMKQFFIALIFLILRLLLNIPSAYIKNFAYSSITSLVISQGIPRNQCGSIVKILLTLLDHRDGRIKEKASIALRKSWEKEEIAGDMNQLRIVYSKMFSLCSHSNNIVKQNAKLVTVGLVRNEEIVNTWLSLLESFEKNVTTRVATNNFMLTNQTDNLYVQVLSGFSGLNFLIMNDDALDDSGLFARLDLLCLNQGILPPSSPRENSKYVDLLIKISDTQNGQNFILQLVKRYRTIMENLNSACNSEDQADKFLQAVSQSGGHDFAEDMRLLQHKNIPDSSPDLLENECTETPSMYRAR